MARIMPNTARKPIPSKPIPSLENVPSEILLHYNKGRLSDVRRTRRTISGTPPNLTETVTVYFPSGAADYWRKALDSSEPWKKDAT